MRHSRFLLSVCVIAAAALAGVAAQQKSAAPTQPKVTVYKTSSCGCCRLWVDHMKASGFDVQAMDVSEDTSCHTAKIGEYTVEGHVPAADIKRMLKEKPAIAGLSAPGMPLGSPGMEQGNMKQPYDVIAFKKDGTSTVYAKHK
jgi:hypothetical protein